METKEKVKEETRKEEAVRSQLKSKREMSEKEVAVTWQGKSLVVSREVEMGEILLLETAVLELPPGKAKMEREVERRVEMLCKEELERLVLLQKRLATMERMSGRDGCRRSVEEIFFSRAVGGKDGWLMLFPTIASLPHSCLPTAAWQIVNFPSLPPVHNSSSISSTPSSPTTTQYWTESSIPSSCCPPPSARSSASCLKLMALRTLQPGDKVTVSYLGPTERFCDTSQRQESLLQTWGFLCTCKLCSEKGQEEEVARGELRCLQEAMARECNQDPKGIRWSWLAELQRRAVDIVRHLSASDNLLPRELCSLAHLAHLARQPCLLEQTLSDWRKEMTEGKTMGKDEHLYRETLEALERWRGAREAEVRPGCPEIQQFPWLL